MSHLKRKLYGWKESDADVYEYCFNTFGGSVNMHPDVIRLFSSRSGQKASYYHKEKNGRYVAAYALLDNKTVGVDEWKNFPLSYDEVLIPAKKNAVMAFPEKLNRLSHFNRSNFLNVNFSVARKNRVCFVKDLFSAKTEKNRRNEFNRFIKSGGRCEDVRNFSPEELANIYTFLFESRFAGTVKGHSKENICEMLKGLRSLLFGHVLFVNDEPCAIDLLFMAESESMVYVDVPNGGVNVKYSDLSPGSLLMWRNIAAVREYCQRAGKEMRFSIGSLDKEWTYKLRWADARSTGKTVI